MRSGGHAFPAFHRPTARLVFAPFSVGRVIPRKTDRRRASRPRHRRARGFSDRRAHLASRARGSWKCEETDPRDRRRRDVSRRRRGRRVPGPRHRARACRKTRPRYPARDRRGALRLEGVRGRAAGEAGVRGARDRRRGGGPTRGRATAGEQAGGRRGGRDGAPPPVSCFSGSIGRARPAPRRLPISPRSGPANDA